MRSILAVALALSDRDLLSRIGTMAGREREATAELVAHLAALEMRPSAYAAQGYGSLFEYCIAVLRLSEDAACNRIDAARACARFPVILDMLAAGSLTLTSIRKLRGHLTPENHEAVLDRAANRTKEQIEALIAELAPKPDVPASVRRVPIAGDRIEQAASSGEPSLLDSVSSATPMSVPKAAAPGATSASETLEARAVPSPPRPIVQALSPQRYRVQFTIGQQTHDRLRRVQALLRRQVPDGDPAAIFDRALALLEEVERKKRGFGPESGRGGRATGPNYENRIRPGTDKARREVRAPDAPDVRSRHIPVAVKRAVWWRDAGQCAFVAGDGRRCTERSYLELHHIQPFALDGPPTVSNIALRCRRHNCYEAQLVFGPAKARVGAVRSPPP